MLCRASAASDRAAGRSRTAAWGRSSGGEGSRASTRPAAARGSERLPRIGPKIPTVTLVRLEGAHERVGPHGFARTLDSEDARFFTGFSVPLRHLIRRGMSPCTKKSALSLWPVCGLSNWTGGSVWFHSD